MFSKIFTAGLAAFAPLAAAYTQPTGDAPVGNPISQPGLNSIVPAGESFTVTWDPTTEGTVTLVLLKGPSENAVPQYAIVEGYENNGTYVWTPSTELEPTTGAKGYGIQLIVDATGQYQYTTQFGISNPDYDASAPTYGESSSASATPYAPQATPTYQSAPVYGTVVSSGYAAQSTGHWASNVTMVAPTGAKPASTLKTTAATTAPSATFTGPIQANGAASNVAVSVFGLVAAAGAAVLAI